MSTVLHLKIMKCLQEYCKHSISFDRRPSTVSGAKARAALLEIRKLAHERRKEIREKTIEAFAEKYGQERVEKRFNYKPNEEYLQSIRDERAAKKAAAEKEHTLEELINDNSDEIIDAEGEEIEDWTGDELQNNQKP